MHIISCLIKKIILLVFSSTLIILPFHKVKKKPNTALTSLSLYRP